jgi:N-acetylmuramoyl-L-alanine amidase
LKYLAASTFLLLSTLPTAAETVRAEAGPGLVAALGDDHRLWLEAEPEKGEGLLAFSRRLCGNEDAAAAIAAANGGSRRLVAGVRYRVPYELLRPALQLGLVRTLFAEDRFEGDGPESGWRHTVRGVGLFGRESLWHLATWFTGEGDNFRAIREANGLVEEELLPGQVVTIPADLLLPAFRTAGPAGPAVRRAEGFRTAQRIAGSERPDYGLEYGKDRQGDYAVYRLRPGEALYSSVVVRFTGHVTAADVNALAREIAERSGIRDVTDIPVDYAVKVPFDLLLPEFLPPGHPRRQAYEESLAASSAFSNEIRALDLAGITVILDAGHGGRDVGASVAGVWESLYVYDVMVRVRKLLTERTAARVFTTTRDGDRFHTPERDVLPFSRGHRVLTEPHYPIEDSRVGVNLRWYLANSLYRRAVHSPEDSEKVVFLSLHGDSLHPSLRGMMAYIPAANLSGGTYGKSGAVYAGRKEVRERPKVSYSWRERVKSEGLSRQLAERMVESFRGQGLAIHPFKPVREKVIRNRREWVPAVLRYNAVPAKILVEICNLANPEDRRLIQTRAYRQKVAEALVAGILAYYSEGGDAGPGKVQTAR